MRRIAEAMPEVSGISIRAGQSPSAAVRNANRGA